MLFTSSICMIILSLIYYNLRQKPLLIESFVCEIKYLLLVTKEFINNWINIKNNKNGKYWR